MARRREAAGEMFGERVEAACDKRCGDGGKESEAEKKVVCEDEKAASCGVIR